MPKREAKGRKHRPKTPQKTMDQRDKDTTVLAAVPKTCCWHTKAPLLAHQSNLAGTPTKLQKKNEKKGGGTEFWKKERRKRKKKIVFLYS